MAVITFSDQILRYLDILIFYINSAYIWQWSYFYMNIQLAIMIYVDHSSSKTQIFITEWNSNYFFELKDSFLIPFGLQRNIEII